MCLYTKYILNPKYLPNKKNDYNPPVCTDERLRYVPTACGVCIECRKEKKRNWCIRLNEEMKNATVPATFVTFTFSDDWIKRISEQLAIKKNPSYEELNQICYYALRHYMELYRKYNNEKYPRYWFITELGEDFERIHMHGILWGDSSLLKLWRYGYWYKGDYVNEKTINYITKYMLKIPEKNPEFIGKVMASKGIGKGYWKSYNARRNRYVPGRTNENYKLPNGTEIPLPQYYRNYIYTDREKEKLWIEKQERGYRYIGGEKVMMDDEETWANLTKYYQNISETVWNINPIKWEAEKQKKRLAKMKKALRRVNNSRKSVDNSTKSVNKPVNKLLIK